MRRNKVSLLLLLGLLLGLVIYNLQFFSKGKPVKMASAMREQKEELKFETLKRKSLEEGWGRNPFFPTEQMAPPPPKEEIRPTLPPKLLPPPKPSPAKE